MYIFNLKLDLTLVL